MAGFLVGVAFGLAALFCLSRFTLAMTEGRPERAVLPLLGNFLAIAGGLLIAAFAFRSQLAQTGIGLAAALVGGAVSLFIIRVYRKKR